MDRNYPLALNVLGNVPLGPTPVEEQKVVSQLIENGLSWDQARTGWLDRQQALTKLRYGIRKPKTFPWKGASNIGIPLIDSSIRRYKPMLLRLVVEPDPIVEFVGEDAEAVAAERMAEAEYNWLWRTSMNATESVAYIIDAICHRGFGIAQVGWEYQTEYTTRVVAVADLFKGQQPTSEEEIAKRLIDEYELDISDPRVVKALTTAVRKIVSGAPAVKLGFKTVTVDRPAVYDRDPVQVIVPPRTTDYANAECVIVQHIHSVRKLQQLEADGFFDRGTVEKITADLRKNADRWTGGNPLDSATSSGLLNDEREADAREKIWGIENDDSVLIWECFHWADVDNDGLKDRVITYLHPRSRTKLASRPYPYPFAKWPFVKFDFEKTSRRFHSPRGISGMLEALQREVNAQHNARLDAMTMRNAPIYQVPVLAGFKARNFRAVPGTVLQLPMGARLEPVMQDRSAWPEQMGEENSLRSLAESYIGTFDQTLMNNFSGGKDNRTATEVNAALQLAGSTASLDAILFQLSMRDLHMMVWQIWVELRPDEVRYKVLGQDPKANGPQLVSVKKADVAKKFNLVPTGTVANTNRSLELSNAREALQFFANDQSGFINGQELRSWYFSLLDYRRARRIINAPEQAAELQMLRQAAAQLQQNPELAAQLGLPGQSGVAPPPQTEQMPVGGE